MAESKFVAKQDIFIGMHRAHVKGDEVPAENVQENGWEDLVAREGTKGATEVHKDVEGANS